MPCCDHLRTAAAYGGWSTGKLPSNIWTSGHNQRWIQACEARGTVPSNHSPIFMFAKIVFAVRHCVVWTMNGVFCICTCSVVILLHDSDHHQISDLLSDQGQLITHPITTIQCVKFKSNQCSASASERCTKF